MALGPKLHLLDNRALGAGEFMERDENEYISDFADSRYNLDNFTRLGSPYLGLSSYVVGLRYRGL